MTSHAEERVTLAEPARPDAAVPRHVAIIMDGNGRWAAKRGLPRSAGHRQGVEAVRRTVTAATDAGIEYLTLFSFSSENWSRPPTEVEFLLGLLRMFIRRDVARLHRKGVRISVIGSRARLPEDVARLIDEAEALTSANTGLKLIFAFNYGARDEITRAIRRIARKVAEGGVDPDEIDETMIAAHLDTGTIPDPDLLIRTSGELRLSNFLLWQSAYSELVFLPIFWPDFGSEALQTAIDQYALRTRRYGGLAARSKA